MCVYVCMMGVRMEPIITGTGGGSMDGTLVFLYKLDENFCLCFIARIFFFEMKNYVTLCWILRSNAIGSSGFGAKYKLLFVEMLDFIKNFR